MYSNGIKIPVKNIDSLIKAFNSVKGKSKNIDLIDAIDKLIEVLNKQKSGKVEVILVHEKIISMLQLKRYALVCGYAFAAIYTNGAVAPQESIPRLIELFVDLSERLKKEDVTVSFMAENAVKELEMQKNKA